MGRKNKALAVLGGDRRLRILEELLVQGGYTVLGYDEWAGSDAAAGAVICPIPFTKDGESIFCESGLIAVDGVLAHASRYGEPLIAGAIPASVAEKARAAGVEVYDVMEDEAMAEMNAAPTAEGAIAAAMAAGDITISGSSCLVLGYGRCGRALCQRLRGLGADVAASYRPGGSCGPDGEGIRSAGFEAVPIGELGGRAGGFDFIFNTVPALVLDGERLAATKKNAVIIDIASAPGGVDFAAARRMGVNARLCPGLPGLAAPRSAAAALYESVMRFLNRQSPGVNGMKLKGKRIGLVMCGSFCTFDKIMERIPELLEAGAEILPIMSDNAYGTDTRFGSAEDFRQRFERLTGKPVMHTIAEAEAIGPGDMTDIMLVAPCTGNTLAKLCRGVTDTAALMAVKSHLRGNKPVCVFVATNDALGFNLENIGRLLNAKNFYFVPFCQDNYKAKPKSMMSRPELMTAALESALDSQQLQPLIAAQA